MMELVSNGRYEVKSVFTRWLQRGHYSLHLKPAGSLQKDDIAVSRLLAQIRDQRVSLVERE